MFENLSEQAKTYVTYGATAITGAVVSAACIFLGLAVNRHYHPAPLAAKAVTGDILAAAQDEDVEALRRQLNELNGQTQNLIQAQTDAENRARTAQEAVDGVPEGSLPTPAQTNELAAARRVLANAKKVLAEHNKRKTELTAQIAINGVIADEGQRTVLVNIINNLDPVFKAQAQAAAAAAAAAAAPV